MSISLLSRPSSSATRPLSALLSQSNDDFYSKLQTVMNALPIHAASLPVTADILPGEVQQETDR